MVDQPEQQQPAPPRISAVVVSRNRVALLRRCLDALEHCEARETIEIEVVDNGSRDGSAALDSEFPAARFIRLPKNFGLTKALNLGIRASETEYVLLLHDDTEVEPGAVRLLAETLDARPEAFAVCPLLVDAEGKPAPQLGSLPPDGQYRAATPGSEPMEVEYPCGAAIMLRRFLITSIRQLDERYGQFGSDADIAQQVRRAGKKVLLVPAARARHAGRAEEDSLRRADERLGRAVWVGKNLGFAAGVSARIGAVLGPLSGLRLGEAWDALGGQKINGSQE